MDDGFIIFIISAMLLLLAIGIGGFLFFRRRAAKPKKKPAQVPGKQPILNKANQTPAAPKQAASPPPVTKPANPTPAPTPSAATVRPSFETPTQPMSQPRDSAGDEGKIRILIVDDNRETSEHVSRLLYFEDDMTVVGQAFNGREGVDLAIAQRPHIVLMDINMPDMDGITATGLLTERMPFSQVIMISVQSDPEYMKQAMLAGARDYQPKPFSSEELINCIRRVYQIGQPAYQQFESGERRQPVAVTHNGVRATSARRDGKVVALFSPKGGVGVSTVAANLAVALQKKGSDTVLVDANLQFGDVLVHFNIRDTRSMSNLVQSGELALDLLPELLIQHSSGLRLLLGPLKPIMAEAITPAAIGSVLTDLKSRFDLVIVDTSHLLTDQMLAVLEHANHVLIVAVPELPAVKSTRQFFELSHQLDFSLKKMSLVINCADRPGGIPAAQIEKALKLPQIYHIPYDFDIHVAGNQGVVLTERDTKKEVSQAIFNLAEQLRQRLAEANEAELESQVA